MNCDVGEATESLENELPSYISTPSSPEVENFQIKIYYPAGDQTPDLLNQTNVQLAFMVSPRIATDILVTRTRTIVRVPITPPPPGYYQRSLYVKRAKMYSLLF